MSPREYLRVYQRARDNIASVRVVPPSFRKNDWGRILVRFKVPMLMHGR